LQLCLLSQYVFIVINLNNLSQAILACLAICLFVSALQTCCNEGAVLQLSRQPAYLMLQADLLSFLHGLCKLAAGIISAMTHDQMSTVPD